MALLSTTDFPFSIKKNDGFSHGRIDLHCHTHCSDGGLSPQTLVDRAVNYQIDVLAITDHDTVAGFNVAQDYIMEKNIPLKLITGIEISTEWQGFEIHIVGLNFDENNSELQQLIHSQQQAREQRAITIGEKLAKCGFPDAYHDAKQLAGNGTITRAHFAKVLHQQGHVGTEYLAAAADRRPAALDTRRLRFGHRDLLRRRRRQEPAPRSLLGSFEPRDLRL